MAGKYVFLIALIVIIDQILKNTLKNIVKNYGASFNILQNYSLFLTLISLVSLIVFVYFFIKSKEKLAFVFLIAGTLSNLIDRLALGYIIDYI